jgi:hypothetical protein
VKLLDRAAENVVIGHRRLFPPQLIIVPEANVVGLSAKSDTRPRERPKKP